MSNMNNMTSLIFYKKLKLLWGEETYLKLCGRKERIGICWLRTGIWRLRNKRGDLGKEYVQCVEKMKIYCNSYNFKMRTYPKFESQICRKEIS